MKAVLENLRSDLNRRQTEHLYRSRTIMDSPQGVDVKINGKCYINFSSNDYLGLASHPDVIKAFKIGADKFGVGSGAAHLLNGHSRAHHALEEELAEFCGRERALLFSTGYMANLGVITALLSKHDAIYEDKLNHASIIDGGLLSGAKFHRYLHADTDNLKNKLNSKHNVKHKGINMIATDGVFSMDGDIAPITELAQIATQNNTLLMVDDAHGLGVIGETGRGILELHKLNSKNVPILMGTLGKAFGTFGAFIAGDEILIETLIQKSRSYLYTTALPPAIAHATRMSLQLMIDEPERRTRLHEHISQFKNGAEQLGLPLMPSDTPIQPLLINDAEKVLLIKNKLQQQGILVGAIRSPTVATGTERLRITLSTRHLSQHIEQLLDTIKANL